MISFFFENEWGIVKCPQFETYINELGKILTWSNFENNNAGDDILKKNELGMSEFPSLIVPKKKYLKRQNCMNERW